MSLICKLYYSIGGRVVSLRAAVTFALDTDAKTNSFLK